MKQTTFGSLSGILLAAMLAQPANAQALATGEDKAGSDDIVVTAQRTSSLASKTPIALNAIGGEALQQAGVTNPLRLEEQVPSLSIVRNNGLQITIRGISSP